MALCGFVWLCVALCGFVWLCGGVVVVVLMRRSVSKRRTKRDKEKSMKK